MLDYLVTSKARRQLLLLLWGENQTGSVSELAGRAGVAFSTAQVELKGMAHARLACVHHADGKDVYAANHAHPKAKALASLTSEPRAAARDDRGDDALKRRLVALGAPLAGVEPRAVGSANVLGTLVEGVSAARRSPTIARALPICFWKQREVLDARILGTLVTGAEDKHALGFFLELTGELGGDRRLVGLAEGFRDRRMTSVREFFQTGRPTITREFPLATKWGFQMNAAMDSFKSLFDKFVHG